MLLSGEHRGCTGTPPVYPFRTRNNDTFCRLYGKIHALFQQLSAGVHQIAVSLPYSAGGCWREFIRLPYLYRIAPVVAGAGAGA